ncbi:MAG: hypothetical protein ACREJS_16670 [Candidatus Rokuibacteriota bacterium]
MGAMVQPVPLLAVPPPPGPQDPARLEAEVSAFLRGAIVEASNRFGLTRRRVSILFGSLVAERD